MGTATILHPYHPLYGQSFPILKIRKVDGQRRYSLRSEDDIFSVPESWVTDTGQNAFSESYFNADTVRSLLELAKFL
ncbi:MAG: Y4bD/Y4pK family protein [Lachnospiraceae bacterium]